MSSSFAEIQTIIMMHIERSADAAETVAGVNSIWLGRSHTAANLVEVEHALDELVAMHRLEKHSLPGGAMVYRRRQDSSSRGGAC